MSSDFNQLLAKAYKLLSYRPRSQQEIFFRLQKTKSDPNSINQVINTLIDQQLLSDHEFAQWWVDQRSTHRPRGNIGLTSELKQKGIDSDIISLVLLSPQKEKQLAKKLISQKQKTKTPLPKLTRFLLSRGFPSQLVFSLVDELKSKE